MRGRAAYEWMLNRFEIGLNIKLTHILSMRCLVEQVVKLATDYATSNCQNRYDPSLR